MTSTTTAATTAGTTAATDPSGPRLRLIRYEPDPGEPPPAGPPRPTPLVAPPVWEPEETERAARPAAARVLRLALEVLDGRRPASQLAAHLEPRALRYWRAALPASRPAVPSRLLRLVLCVPATGVAEVAAVCRIGGRVRALAARFEQAGADRTRWRCTVVRLG